MLKKTSVEHLERRPEMASATSTRSTMAAEADWSLAMLTMERVHTVMQLARWPFVATVVLVSLPIMHWVHPAPDAMNAPALHSFLDLLDANFNGPTAAELAAKTATTATGGVSPMMRTEIISTITPRPITPRKGIGGGSAVINMGWAKELVRRWRLGRRRGSGKGGAEGDGVGRGRRKKEKKSK
jgi:hypothetical protein